MCLKLSPNYFPLCTLEFLFRDSDGSPGNARAVKKISAGAKHQFVAAESAREHFSPAQNPSKFLTFILCFSM